MATTSQRLDSLAKATGEVMASRHYALEPDEPARGEVLLSLLIRSQIEIARVLEEICRELEEME